MKIIGLLSDTHGYLPERVLNFFSGCDEIWHAGDIGNMQVIEQLKKMAFLRGVYGNIDGQEIRQLFPESNLFDIEGLKVLMLHIGGYPGRYTSTARKLIQQHRPGLFISGHSHILKVMPDKKYNLLYINPGAAGNYGFHKRITAVRFHISAGRPYDLEVLDMNRKTGGKVPV